MMTMTTVGFGDIHAQTEVEYVFVTFAMLAGGFVFAMIVGFLGEMSKNANPAESFRQQKVGLINSFVVLTSDTPELTARVRDFLAHHNEAQTAMDTMQVLRELPWGMTHDLAAGMHWVDSISDSGQRLPGQLSKVPFFATLDEYTCVVICARLKHQFVRRAELDLESGARPRIFEEGSFGLEFYIVLEGSVTLSRTKQVRQGAEQFRTVRSVAESVPLGVAKSGDCFGERAVLLPPELRVPRLRSAEPESDASLASLSYYDLRDLRAEEPGVASMAVCYNLHVRRRVWWV
jgi:hypothetical protein